MLIIHSAETGTIEYADKCFIYDVPDDLSSEETAQWLIRNLDHGTSVTGALEALDYLANK